MQPLPDMFGPSSIRVLDAPNFSGTRRSNSNDPYVTVDQKSGIPISSPRQYSVTRDQVALRNTSLFIPHLNDPGSLWINGVPQADTDFTPHPFPGSGLFYIKSEIDAVLLNPVDNQLSIRAEVGQIPQGISAVLIGPAASVERLTGYLQSLGLTINGLSLIGLILNIPLSLIIWFLANDRLLGSAGILFCIYFLLLQIWEQIQAVPLSAPMLDGLALLLCFLVSRHQDIPVIHRTVLRTFCCIVLLCVATQAFGYAAGWSGTSIFPVLWTSELAIVASLFLIPPFMAVIKTRQFQTLLLSSRSEAEIKSKALEQTESRLREEIANAAVLKERQRFTRDVHDGIGGQLLSLLLKVRSRRTTFEDIEYSLQNGLNDLRLVVDSLDHVGDDLGGALTTFHARAEAQLAAERIAFKWHQDAELDKVEMDTRTILHIYRFLQEVVSNVNRHAKASHMEIAVNMAPDREHVTVRAKDNGVGFDVAQQPKGRGLRSLHERAEKVDGELTLQSSSDGTEVRFSVPVSDKRRLPTDPASLS